MELDNIIYIILTVIIFAASLIGQSKKRKNTAPVENEANDDFAYSLNDFEKILERKQEFISRQEEIKPVKEVFPEKIIEKKEIKKAVKNQPNKEESEIDDGFDLKSAIIYSSILERKKFRH
jgi:hypothetical protein